MQTFGTRYNPAFSGEVRVPLRSLPPLPMGERKIIARRAAMELPQDAIVNLGTGAPEKIANVAAEEGISDKMTLTVEAGSIAGVPMGGTQFGAAANSMAIIPQTSSLTSTRAAAWMWPSWAWRRRHPTAT